ncbi:MAG: hypothetical protein PHZ00_06815 [Candidatus Peribacteraceae bacterium]|nr:hypothetical protein [Candidatus Peribacteraceae bacterium]
MFCIAAFIVFLILAIFSATFRPLAAKAWHCVIRRVSFRPCDIDFSEEMKGKIIGKMMKHSPALAAFVSRWIDWFSFAFVALSIWSLVYAGMAGLNLFVYDTCNPLAVESCSLGGEACGVQQQVPGLVQSWKSGQMMEWMTGPFTRFATTVGRIPDRLRTWNAAEFVGPTATFIGATDPTAPIALEVMDPLCQFCKKLLGNMEAAGIDREYRITYLLYPIPDGNSPTGTKFAFSRILAQYIESAKTVRPGADWDLIRKIFANRDDGTDWQSFLRIGATEKEARHTLDEFLAEIGFTGDEIGKVHSLLASDSIAQSLDAQRQIVEKGLRTIKIPTLIIGGRRYDRVVSEGKLRKYSQDESQK